MVAFLATAVAAWAGANEANPSATTAATTAVRLSRRGTLPGAHLVNVSSVYGLVAPPGQTADAASKFAIRGFTEPSRHELPTLGIGVTAVHPGGVRTRIAQNARVGAHVSDIDVRLVRREFGRLLTIDPRDAAETILDGVERRRTRVLIGSLAIVPDLLARISPAHYWPAVTAFVGLRLG